MYDVIFTSPEYIAVSNGPVTFTFTWGLRQNGGNYTNEHPHFETAKAVAEKFVNKQH